MPYSTNGTFTPVRKKLAAGVNFLKEWSHAPARMGMVCPSGKRLTRAMASHVPQGDGLVVELGAGTGVVTQALLESGVHPERLVVLELASGMVDVLRMRFPGIRIIQGDAAELSRYTENKPIDCIVSSLPLVSLPKPVQDAITDEIHAHLGNGLLIQYTSSFAPQHALDRANFRRISAKRVWLNIPPASVMCFRTPSGQN